MSSDKALYYSTISNNFLNFVLQEKLLKGLTNDKVIKLIFCGSILSKIINEVIN